MDEKDGIIEALKISNNERQKIIDDMIQEIIEKEKINERLRRRVNCLTENVERLMKK